MRAPVPAAAGFLFLLLFLFRLGLFFENDQYVLTYLQNYTILLVAIYCKSTRRSLFTFYT